jgi:uncharacterized membrane protein YfhO
VYGGSCECKQLYVFSVIVSICACDMLQRLFPLGEAKAWACIIIMLACLRLSIACVIYAHVLSGDYELTAANSLLLLGK